jgi:hypothetical protein
MLFEGFGHHVVVAQTAQALAGLFREAVIAALLGATNAAAAGHFEPLRGGLSGFHLGHEFLPCFSLAEAPRRDIESNAPMRVR